MTTTAESRAVLPPAVDYTDKDYRSLRRALLDLAALRLPEWTDRSPADIGVLMVDLFAYVGDVVSYYQDRIASELYLSTAVDRRAVQDLLRLVGYELAPPVAASADLDVLFDPPGPDPMFRIRRGQRFETKPPSGSGLPALPFTYLGPDLDIDRSTLPLAGDKPLFTGLPVNQCEVVDGELIGSSTGEPDQTFALARRPVVPASVEITVRDVAGDVPWTYREHLLYHEGDDLEIVTSGPTSTDFTIRYGSDAVPECLVVFGDDVFGQIPPRGRDIVATYQVGGGAAGNVGPGIITEARPKPAGMASVTNPRPAAGGADAETLDHAREFGPLAFRSGDRAVTLSDYVTLARRAGGVGKVRARTTGWNRVELYVGAEGDVFAPVPQRTKERIVAFFENRRMVGTSVWVRDPTPVLVDITVDIIPEHHRDPFAVRDECLVAVRDLLAYRNVDFGRPVYLSKVYEAVEALAGVAAANVSRFRRRDQIISKAVLSKLATAGLGTMTQAVSLTFAGEVAAAGRIEVGEFEIPVEGEVTINVELGA